MTFTELQISEPILKAITKYGYTQPTPIQSEAIPLLLQNSDVLGCAQTGTGKTAAFAIPILQHLSTRPCKTPTPQKTIRALIVAPTRELATQICDCFNIYSTFLPQKATVVFGGVSKAMQIKALKKGVDVLVATPGRLLDLIGQGFISLNNVEHFVLDEADHMFDMGMIQDVQRIIKLLPKNRQTMLFSATMPKEIESLAQAVLTNPTKIEITPEYSPIDIIKQNIYLTDKESKNYLLVDYLNSQKYDSVIIFSRTKYGCEKIVKELANKGFEAVAIHGNKSQNNRERSLKLFKERKVRILVATDIAARGLDIKELSHVINYNLPEAAETYVHRIGRTGRAGLGGTAVSFCDFEELSLLKAIQKLIKKTIPEVMDHPYPMIVKVIKPKGQRQGNNRGNSQKNQTNEQPQRPRNNDLKNSNNQQRTKSSNRSDKPREFSKQNSKSTSASSKSKDASSYNFPKRVKPPRKKNGSSKNKYN